MILETNAEETIYMIGYTEGELVGELYLLKHIRDDLMGYSLSSPSADRRMEARRQAEELDRIIDRKKAILGCQGDL